MAAVAFWTRKVFRYFIEIHVAMIDLDQQLHGTLQPRMQAPRAFASVSFDGASRPLRGLLAA